METTPDNSLASRTDALLKGVRTKTAPTGGQADLADRTDQLLRRYQKPALPQVPSGFDEEHPAVAKILNFVTPQRQTVPPVPSFPSIEPVPAHEPFATPTVSDFAKPSDVVDLTQFDMPAAEIDRVRGELQPAPQVPSAVEARLAAEQEGRAPRFLTSEPTPVDVAAQAQEKEAGQRIISSPLPPYMKQYQAMVQSGIQPKTAAKAIGEMAQADELAKSENVRAETLMGKEITAFNRLDEAISAPAQEAAQTIAQTPGPTITVPDYTTGKLRTVPLTQALTDAGMPAGAVAATLLEGIPREAGQFAAGMILDPKNWPFILSGTGAFKGTVRPALRVLVDATFAAMMQTGAIKDVTEGNWQSAAVNEAFALMGAAGLAGKYKDGLLALVRERASSEIPKTAGLLEPAGGLGTGQRVAGAVRGVVESAKQTLGSEVVTGAEAKEIRAKQAEAQAPTEKLTREDATRLKQLGYSNQDITNMSLDDINAALGRGGPGARLKFMLTRADKDALRSRGFSDEEINRMKPAEATAALREQPKAPPAAPEAQPETQMPPVPRPSAESEITSPEPYVREARKKAAEGQELSEDERLALYYEKNRNWRAISELLDRRGYKFGLEAGGNEYSIEGGQRSSTYVVFQDSAGDFVKVRVSDHREPLGQGGQKRGGYYLSVAGDEFHDPADYSISPGGLTLKEALSEIEKRAKPPLTEEPQVPEKGTTTRPQKEVLPPPVEVKRAEQSAAGVPTQPTAAAEEQAKPSVPLQPEMVQPEPPGAKTWYRGVMAGAKEGDRFYTTDKEVAGDFAAPAKVGGELGRVAEAKPEELPKNVFRATDKAALAEELGLADKYKDPTTTRAFDEDVKRILSARGYDGVEYSEGTFGAEELHAFGREEKPTVLPPVSAAPEAEREPWQMTRTEYADQKEKLVSGQSVSKTRKMAETYHHLQVIEAVRAGKPVPPEVLADYPGLAHGAAEGVPSVPTTGWEVSVSPQYKTGDRVSFPASQYGPLSEQKGMRNGTVIGLDEDGDPIIRPDGSSERGRGIAIKTQFVKPEQPFISKPAVKAAPKVLFAPAKLATTPEVPLAPESTEPAEPQTIRPTTYASGTYVKFRGVGGKLHTAKIVDVYQWDDNREKALAYSVEKYGIVPTSQIIERVHAPSWKHMTPPPTEETSTVPTKPEGVELTPQERVPALIDRFATAIREHNMPTDPRDVREMAKQTVGGDPAQYVDDIYDSLEGATNMALRMQRDPEGTLGERIALAQKYEDALAKRTRTIEITKRQQFSTPLPIAEAVAYAADTKPGESVLEPTAGTGNLIEPFDHGEKVHAIEIEPRRVAVLRKNDFDTTEGDYIRTKIEPKVDAIVTNPPWGKISTGRYAALDVPAPWGKYGDVSERFFVKNLNDVKEGGRVVALMPTTVLGANSIGFRKWLAANHTVRAWIQSPPGAYTRRGTDVESILLVVDKGKVPGDTLLPIQALDKDAPKDYSEYAKAIQPLSDGGSHARNAESLARPAETALGTGTPVRPETALPERPATRGGLPAGRPVRQGVGELRPGGEGPSSDLVPAPPAEWGEIPESTGTPQLVRQGTPALRPEGVAPARLAEFDAAANSPIFTPYAIRSGARGTPHPRQVVETRSLAGAPAPELTYKPSAGVMDAHDRGVLSDEQVDAVASVGQANREGHAIMIADDVGLGKSREIGARAMDLIENEGKKRILFTSKGEVNLRDFEQELKILWGVAPDAKLPVRFEYLRDNPQSSERGSAAKEWQPLATFEEPTIYAVEAGNLNAFRRAISALDVDAVLADEVHSYKNIEGAKVGQTWKALHKEWLARKIPISYYSATPATMVDELEYLYGLREWSPDGFADWLMLRTGRATEADLSRARKAMEEERIPGGDVKDMGSDATDLDRTGERPVFRRGDIFSAPISTAEMEQIMRELKMRGKYMARDLWRGGVEFSQVDKPLTPTEEEGFGKAVRFMRDVEEAWWKYKAMNQNKNSFGPSSQLQFAAKRILFDMRLDRAIEEAKAALARGEQPIISLINVSEVKEGEGNLASVIRGINIDHVLVDKDTGEVEDLGEIPEAIAARNELLERYKEEFPDSPDPIRKIREAFGGKGKVAVVIGNESAKERRKEMELFQSGQKRIIVISGAGKTGINLHHVKWLKDGEKGRRHLIEADYEWSATNFKQELGRSDRAGQLTSPKVSMLTMGMAAEKKFVATIANRLKAQGAVSKGAGESGTAEPLEHYEIGGDYDNIAMRDTWSDLPRELKMYFRGSKFMERMKDGSLSPRPMVTQATVKDFMLQLQLIPVKEGNEIWDRFWETRERLLTGENAEEREMRKTQKSTGTITRSHELQPDLTLYEVKDALGHRSGILVGMITDKMGVLRRFITPEGGTTPKREYVQFRANDGSQLSGLRIPPSAIKPLALAFGKKVAYKHTASSAFSDLQAGDKIPLANDWELRVGKAGERANYIVIEGAKLSNTDRGKAIFPHGAAYNAVSGGFFHLGKADAANAADRVQKFLERFPIKSQLTEVKGDKGSLEGPGTPSARQTPDIAHSSLRQLADSIARQAKLEKATTPQQRASIANRLAEKSSAAKSKIVQALEKSKAAAAAALDWYRTAGLTQTDFKDATKDLNFAFQKADFDGKKLADAIKEAIPDKTRREAMTNWIEADGDTEVLRQRAEQAQPRFRHGYEVALNLSDQEKLIARNIMNTQDAIAQDDIKAGLLEHLVDLYMMHIWKRENPLTKRIRAEVNASLLEPNPSFAKKRIWGTYFEGEQLGGNPVDKDAGYLVSARYRASVRAKAARAYIKELSGDNASDGRPLTAVSGSGRVIEAPEGGNEAYIMRPRTKPEDTYDYRVVDHPALRKWKWAGKDENGKPIFLQGDMLVHPEIYNELKNILGRSWFRAYTIPKTEIRPFAALLAVGREAKSTLLSLSGFHQVQEGTHAAFHKVSPFPGGTVPIDLEDPDQARLVRNGLMVVHTNALAEFGEGNVATGLVNRLPVLGPRLQNYQAWLFGDYIPRLKMKMALDAYERNTKRYKNLTPDQVAELTADQGNAAFGELNYLTMARNPTFQDFLRFTLLAPDFLEARARFAGQAFKPYGREQAMALLRGALGLYVAARILNKLLDDDYHWDWHDMFSVAHKGERYTLRSVPGDVLHAFSDPRGFVYNRLNPLFGKGIVEGLTGRDRFGRQRKFSDLVADIVKGLAPIPTQGLIRDYESRPIETLLSAQGVSTSKYRTPAERKALQLATERTPKAPLSDEQIDQFRLRRKYEQQIEDKEFDAKAFLADVDAGKLSDKDAESIAEMSQTGVPPQLERDFKRLTVEEALEVWKLASASERDRLIDLFIKKASSLDSKPRIVQEKVFPQLESAIREYAQQKKDAQGRQISMGAPSGRPPAQGVPLQPNF